MRVKSFIGIWRTRLSYWRRNYLPKILSLKNFLKTFTAVIIEILVLPVDVLGSQIPIIDVQVNQTPRFMLCWNLKKLVIEGSDTNFHIWTSHRFKFLKTFNEHYINIIEKSSSLKLEKMKFLTNYQYNLFKLVSEILWKSLYIAKNNSFTLASFPGRGKHATVVLIDKKRLKKSTMCLSLVQTLRGRKTIFRSL